MKTNFFLACCCTIMAGAILMWGCNKDDNVSVSATYTISGDASGAQETPPVTTSSTGTLTGTYDSRTNQLQYNITWTGLSDLATVAHFHGPAMAGESASPVIDLSISTNGINGSITGTATLDETVEAHLLAGRLYYNIHTLLHPDGEIRGQVTAVAASN